MPATVKSDSSATSSPFLRALFGDFLFRLLPIFRSEGLVCGWRLSQKSFMSLPHNCIPAVLSSSAKVTPLIFSVGGSTGHGPHTQFLATAQSTKSAPHRSRIMDLDKALGGTVDHGHHNGFRWQCRPLRSVLPFEAAWHTFPGDLPATLLQAPS